MQSVERRQCVLLAGQGGAPRCAALRCAAQQAQQACLRATAPAPPAASAAPAPPAAPAAPRAQAPPPWTAAAAR